jgi:hypothetical protein
MQQLTFNSIDFDMALNDMKGINKYLLEKYEYNSGILKFKKSESKGKNNLFSVWFKSKSDLYSENFNENLFARIDFKENEFNFDVREFKFKEYGLKFFDLKLPPKEEYFVSLSYSDSDSFIDDYKTYIDYMLKTFIHTPRFGCCGMYKKCSDLKKCTHEDKLYSTACFYRGNLEKGRIFYGVNKNI